MAGITDPRAEPQRGRGTVVCFNSGLFELVGEQVGITNNKPKSDRVPGQRAYVGLLPFPRYSEIEGIPVKLMSIVESVS